MSCYITPVIDAIDGRKPSYTINDDKGTIFIPIGKKYKTKAQTFRVAQRLHNKIGDLFGKYEKENAIMASLESREDGTILNITPTPLFKKAMDLVYEIRQQNENERKVRESLRQRQIEGNWFETEEGDIIPIWDADLRIYDSVNIKDSNSSKEPEKIHILGSQADTQGFKNLVSDQNNISQERLNQIRDVFNENTKLANSVYEALGFDVVNLPILDTESITSFEGTKGAAQYDRKNNIIKINRKLLKTKFEEKAWTSPRKLIEILNNKKIESYAEALPENQFENYNEWEQFVINHEYQHSLYSKQDFNKEFPNGTKGEYESEINKRALNQITPEQKQQAQQVYSQYLDTILPDGKVTEIDDSLYISVLNQLEQENKIEKDCTGKGKLKAEKGLQTNFNRGGKWKLIRDLKGYPTHKEGGVDLTIGKNGVSIRNGNTEFTAKHGLVIPKN